MTEAGPSTQATSATHANEAPASQADTIRQGRETRSARVESLRALAALGVMTYHLVLLNYVGHVHVGQPTRVVAVTGLGGLYLFFALSGYLITRPFIRRDFAGGGPVDLRRYFINRAVRILPLYYAAMLVLLLFASRELQANW
jgi:peptidoglycan/LPS O-acetylase OafA/YrhL